jgi:hypothetical protein
LGFKGSIVSNEPSRFEAELRVALISDELVNFSQKTNRELAKKFLDVESISSIAKKFYTQDHLGKISHDFQL